VYVLYEGTIKIEILVEMFVLILLSFHHFGIVYNFVLSTFFNLKMAKKKSRSFETKTKRHDLATKQKIIEECQEAAENGTSRTTIAEKYGISKQFSIGSL